MGIELYDVLKNIQANPKLLMGGAGGTSSIDEEGKILVPSLEVGPNQRIALSESGDDTTISVKSGSATGSGALFLLKSDGSLQGTLFYDESSGKILFQSVIGDMDFQVPAEKFFSFLKSGPDTEKIMRLHVLGTNGGAVDLYISSRDPNGNVTGDPGNFFLRIDGANSKYYIHEGSATSNSDWAEVSTMPPGESNLHSASDVPAAGSDTEIQYNNNGIIDGISGVKSDGTNLKVSGRIDGVGVDGLLLLRAGANSPIGGVVQLEGGGASTTGGKVTSTGGLGPTAGGNVEHTGGESGNGKGGSVLSTGGNGATDDGSGAGGDVNSKGGLGGFDSGKGGDVNVTSGDSQGLTAPSGSINLDIGNPQGGGPIGNILLAKSRGKVGIGISDPNFILDVESNSSGNILRLSADIGNSAAVVAINSERTNQGNVGILNFTHNDVAVSQILGLVTNEPSNFGDLVFSTKGVGGFTPKMIIDENGIMTSRDQEVSRIAPQTIEIFTDAELDALASGGVITDTSQVAYILKANITTSNRFDVSGARFTIGNNGEGYSLTYDGAGTFITSLNSTLIIEATLLATGGGTKFDVSGRVGDIINVDFAGSQGWKMGTIRRSPGAAGGPDVFFLHMAAINWQSTLTLENVSVLTVDEIALIPFAGSGVPFLALKGDTPGSYIIDLVSGSLAAGESLIRVDPAIASSSRITVAGSTLDGALFDISGGTTGTFTVVETADIGPQNIASVSNVGGLVGCNFTPGPEVFIGQEVVLSGFIDNTDYNGTHIILNAGAGIFEINVPFGTDEATGSFSGDSIKLTDTATTLSNGDTLVISTDGATDYDGGGTVYNKQDDSFQINRTFTITHTGTWDTSGLDFRDPRVLSKGNPGSAESKAIAFGHLNGHVGNESITDEVYVAIGPLGFIQHPSSQRFKHISDAPKWEFAGNEPFDGLLTATISATKTGNAANYRFSVGVNAAVPVFATAIYAPMEVKATKVGITLLFPLQLVKGDTVTIYKAGDGTSDTIDITDLSISIQ